MHMPEPLDQQSFCAASPLRLSLGGGGTDLPFYEDEFGCDLTAVALQTRVAVVLGPVPLAPDERGASSVPTPGGYVEAAFALTGANRNRPVAAFSRVPNGSGLGGSAAFAAALVAAADATVGQERSAMDLAEAVWELEMGCGVYAGRQDPYATSVGGLIRLTTSPDSSVSVREISPPQGFMDKLEAHLRLYFTGVTRSSTDNVAAPTGVALRSRIALLHEIKALGGGMVEALKEGSLSKFATLMAAHSELKRATKQAAPWAPVEALALRAGATATKLVGAGGGGFVLVFADPDALPSIDEAMDQAGLPALPVKFSRAGTSCQPLYSYDRRAW
jgi:D-glycero-alpha-D-manno-heptose-7-phosphate kinase